MAELEGFRQVMARFEAIRSPRASTDRMKLLAVAANREQRILTQPNKKTGITQNSIGYSSLSATSVTTQAAGAAIWLERGTKPHIIRPRVAKVLAWGGARRLSGALRKGARAEFFARIVHHPGSRAFPFMLPGARKALEKAGIVESIVDDWNRAA
jgi:hypothetical protein